MKVFFPTTILNIGEILATDSISPASFYKKRGFGSPHWYNVVEGGTGNVFFLYKRCFRFSRPKSDLEDRPMFVCMNIYEDLPMLQDGILYSDHTLYFDWNTRFLFFSEEDRRIAISLSQISESTKMLGLYREKRMDLLQDTKETLEKLVDIREFPINLTAIEADFKVDKIKGIIYGYYIGALLSSSPQEVGALRGMRNLYSHLISAISSYAPIKKDTAKIVNALRDVAKKDLETQEIQIRKQQTPLKIEKKELKVCGEKVISVFNENLKDGNEHELLLTWLNNTLSNKGWGYCVNAVKNELADKLTDDAISVYKEEWKESDTRVYLNNLRHHIAGDCFTQKWSNGLLSSLTAFILRGDDWEDMLRYMQENDMYDYRLAFAFYGAFFGFASMPRSLTNLLFEQEKSYIGQFYGEVYKMILGIEIPKLAVEIKAMPYSHQQWQQNIRDFVSGLKRIQKKDDVVKSLEEAFVEIGDKTDINILLSLLCKKKGWKNKNKPWKEVSNYFSINLFDKQ